MGKQEQRPPHGGPRSGAHAGAAFDAAAGAGGGSMSADAQGLPGPAEPEIATTSATAGKVDDGGSLGRPFRVSLSSFAFTAAAMGVFIAGMPLIAASLTDSPQEISWIRTAMALPALLFGVVIGLIVDGTDRRRARLVALVARSVLLFGGAALALVGGLSIWVLVIFAFAFGTISELSTTAARTITPQLVRREHLARANSREEAVGLAFAEFVGAPIAAALVLLGSAWLLGVPAALTLAGALVLWLGLRGRDFRVPPSEEAGTESRWGTLTFGFRFVLTHRALRPVIIMAMVANFASSAYLAVFVLWMVGPESPVGVTAAQFPFFLTAQAVGAVAGALSVGRLKRLISEVPLAYLGWGSLSVAVVAQVLWPTWYVMAMSLAFLAFGNMVGNITFMTILQRLTPQRVLGRVMGALSTLGSGLAPAGALVGGVVAEAWGLSVLYLGVAVAVALAVLYPTLTVSQRLVDEYEAVTGE